MRSFPLMNRVVILISFLAKDLIVFEQFRLKSIIELTFEFCTVSSKRSSKDLIARLLCFFLF